MTMDSRKWEIEVEDVKLLTILDSNERFAEITEWIANQNARASMNYRNPVEKSFCVIMTDEIYQKFADEFFGVFHRVKCN